MKSEYKKSMKTYEYAVAVVSTGGVFPKVFKTFEEAQRFRNNIPDSSHWKVVCRTVTYSEWNDTKEEQED